ncbi:MAG TPA: succinate dehydrogenase, cytochrome b556 subunit [Candidatus Acidoferrales bacterium]|nr:succinate dehydrogenase, cytochrome b556 subunit [Candidatus Acidoferrales bacterium]
MRYSLRDALRKYRWQFSGMVAWTIQRVTGLLLLAYLFLHVHTVSRLSQGPAAFDRAMATFHSAFFKLLEIGLLGVVVLHASNGIRITLVDLGIGVGRQRHLFWIVTVGAGLLVFLAGAIPLFLFAIGKAG